MINILKKRKQVTVHYVTDLSQMLKKYRKESGMSQVEFARKICVEQAQLSRYENGHAVPSIETLVSICTVLKITAKDLLGV